MYAVLLAWSPGVGQLAGPVRGCDGLAVVCSMAVQGDVLSLRTDVGRGLSSVSGAAAAAGANVALLVQLERVKSRMEAACSTLKVRGSAGTHLVKAERTSP